MMLKHNGTSDTHLISKTLNKLIKYSLTLQTFSGIIFHTVAVKSITSGARLPVWKFWLFLFQCLLLCYIYFKIYLFKAITTDPWTTPVWAVLVNLYADIFNLAVDQKYCIIFVMWGMWKLIMQKINFFIFCILGCTESTEGFEYAWIMVYSRGPGTNPLHSLRDGCILLCSWVQWVSNLDRTQLGRLVSALWNLNFRWANSKAGHTRVGGARNIWRLIHSSVWHLGS